MFTIYRNIAILLAMITGARFSARAQQESADKAIAAVMERLIENSEASLDYTDLQEQLEFYNRHKLNLNTVSRDQLQRLFFLDESQVNAIIKHRVVYGDFIALQELQSIEVLDELTIYYLTFFVAVNESWQADQTSLGQMLVLGKHELIALYDTELQQRSGYDRQRISDGRNYYRGDPSREVLRYRFAYGNRLQYGFTGEKDMGEQFAAGAQKYGFDFNSFHFYYKPRKGLVKTIALGDYQVNFGQGLTFGSGIASRKSAFVLNVRRNFIPLRPYRSLNENEFLRGAAVTLEKRNLQLNLFGSAKRISTDLGHADSLENEAMFGSVSLSGLHRTDAEAARRKNVFQQIYGAHAKWQFKSGHIGITHAQTSYSDAFFSGDKPYQTYNFSGTRLGNTGFDYNLQWGNASLFGEFSRSSNHAYAALSGIIVSLDIDLDLALVYRNYAKNYQAICSNAFGEYTDSRNEQGMYTGASLRLSRRWQLNAYIDVYRSAWLRYLTDGPSHGVDVLGELQYNASKNAQIYFRCRQETKLKNQPDNKTTTDYLSAQERTAYRLHAQYKIGLHLSAKSRLEILTYTDQLVQGQTGTLLFQDLGWSTPGRKLALNMRIAYFSVDDYNARVYAAENDVLYQYSVPLYQNSGTRYYVVARYSINRRMELWLKFSETRYSNLKTIGSGLDEVNGNKISDVRVQVRMIL